MPRPPRSDGAFWQRELAGLCDRIRFVTREHVRRALERRGGRALAKPVGQGAGDVTYAIDVPAEGAIATWHEYVARRRALSVLTEETGWRHLGPGRRGRGGSTSRELDGFDHGGPRLAIDPIDGTRNLMADLRSAWTLVSFAPAGPGQPHLSDLTAGILAEIPDSRAARHRRLSAWSGRARSELFALGGGGALESRALRADRDARADHGYFPFFRYTPAMRPALARLEANFFGRLERLESAEIRHVFDDQYISNAGQLALLALGTYRMVVDARALLTARLGLPSIPSKPYDVAGAIAVARAAGCAVTDAEGNELDFPIDARTPVHFAGFHNEATRARLLPHLRAALRATLDA